MQTLPQIPAWWRNLSRRLPKPAQGCGRVQRACRRALLVHGTASTSEVIAWAYAPQLLIGGDPRDRVSSGRSDERRLTLAASSANANEPFCVVQPFTTLNTTPTITAAATAISQIHTTAASLGSRMI